MHQLNTDFEGAMECVVNHHTEIETRFLDGLNRIPSWGPELDRQVQQYTYGLANFLRGSDCWNFESGRYFGSNGREIQKIRVVPLLPKASPAHQNPSFRRENVVVLLIDSLLEIRL